MTATGTLVCGTASNAGKTTVVAALCRALSRQGLSVTPFKAQNMSLNSAVTDSGHEIARAQMLQAEAARIPANVSMNPVLVKPGTDRRAHLVVNGLPAGEIDAEHYAHDRDALLRVVVAAYRELSEQYEVIIAEGAGSAAEINLRAHDIANLGLATAVDLPVVLVADIDRGGAFASLIGTLSCLEQRDRERVCGFVLNRFRGDISVLQPGLDELTRRTGLPVFGVIPFDPTLHLDAEDSLATDWSPVPRPPLGPDILRVAVVRLPLPSNLTDVEPLAAEPGVVVTFADVPQQIQEADLVILPGTRATVDALDWLRQRGFDTALLARAELGKPILGICGGYQVLGHQIRDGVESPVDVVEGLGLLPVTTTFAQAKTLGSHRRQLADGTPVTGYQIHHGRVERSGGAEMLPGEGCREGSVMGTTWHGLFESDDFRRRLLGEIASVTERQFTPSADSWRHRRDLQLDRLGDIAEQHLAPLVESLARVVVAR